jgi:hypothetical protein
MILNKYIIVIFLFLQISCINKAKISNQSDMDHGDQQVTNMLSDRPKMSFYTDKAGASHNVGPEDEIWKWASTKFLGRDFGQSISWSSDVPDSSVKCFTADHDFAKKFIRVASKYSCSGAEVIVPFDHLWKLATLELLNIEGAEQYRKIQKMALDCKLSKEDYIRENLKIQYNALVKQTIFYKNIWLPWATKKSVNSDARYWHANMEAFDVWYESLKKSSVPTEISYWVYFYDVKLKPILVKNCH